MTLTLPDGEILHHVYDNGGLLKQITGRYDGTDYDYLDNLEYDKFGQRRFKELGNGVKTLYRYDEESRRLCNLQSGAEITSGNDTACQALPESHDSEAVKNALTGLIAGAQGGGAAQFQNLHYANDPLGNMTCREALMPREAGCRKRPSASATPSSSPPTRNSAARCGRPSPTTTSTG